MQQVRVDQLCFGGFEIFSMKNATHMGLEPTTFEAIFAANRTINLRLGGLRSCQKIGWHLI